MTQNLFAACRSQDNELSVKRVRVTQPVQDEIEQIFLAQEAQFMDGVAEEAEFSGDWQPDDDEIQYIEATEEALAVVQVIAQNALAHEDIDSSRFAEQNVRGLFVGDDRRVLVQRFAPQQVLSRRFSLLLDGNTFTKLEQPAFSLDSRLTCIVADGRIKFKKFHSLRQIFDLFDHYQIATDDVVEEFAGKPVFNIDDHDQFRQNADQTCRKLIHAINRDGVLDRHSAEEIASAANGVGLELQISDGAIAVPRAKADLKNMLRFLNDGLYEASLSGQRYVTNSKRKVLAA